jgi:A/G-specific adenine glycosylase
MEFSNKLIKWYLVNKRDFPWRNTREPYKIWLSEVILQQTRTLQGLPYYIAFTKKYKTVQQLANADEQEVLKLWQGLGYYSRARNLHIAAKHIDNEFNGVFPNNYKALLKLKGVGDYTASAIASICFDEKCAVVDGNVYRVLSRYFGIETPINSSKGIKEFKKLAQKLLPKKNYGLYNQAIMDFGATICTPKKTKCNDCIFNDSCFALQHKKVANFPIKISKTKIRNRYFNYLVILSSNNKISIQKRVSKGIWQHLYEFPVIETSKTLHLEELIEHKDFKLFNPESVSLFNSKPIIHKLSHQHIFANFWIVKTKNNSLETVNINELKNYPIPTLIDNFIKDFKL